MNQMYSVGIEVHRPMLALIESTLLISLDAMDAAYYILEELSVRKYYWIWPITYGEKKTEKIGPQALTLIVQACSHKGDLERAYLTYDAYARFGLSPNIDAVNALLEVSGAFEICAS